MPWLNIFLQGTLSPLCSFCRPLALLRSPATCLSDEVVYLAHWQPSIPACEQQSPHPYIPGQVGPSNSS